MKNRWSTRNGFPAIVPIRLAAGLMVFFPEGLQKPLFPEILGAGRFARIGIPRPDFLGPFVGVAETVRGVLIIPGLAARWATLPLIVTIIVALVSTRLPILLGHDRWIFDVRDPSRYGFWSAQHEARNDAVMLLSLVFLLAAGSGGGALDRRLTRRRRPADARR